MRLDVLPARWGFVPAVAAAAALVLLLAGGAATVFTAQSYRTQQGREVALQGKILAASVSAALAFDDRAAAREYVNALAANPQLESAGVYDTQGRLMVAYVRPGMAAAPTRQSIRPGAQFVGNRLTVITPVIQRGQVLGAVYLRSTVEPFTRRVARIGGLVLLILAAALVLGVFAAAQSAMTRANAALRGANEDLLHQIEEREKAEDALRQSQKMEAIGQLTGGIAHDFNNLLMVVSSGVDLLDRTADAKRRAQLMAGVRQAVDRGSGLTRQLLAFSRRTSLKPQVVDLVRQVESLRLLFDRSLGENIIVEIAMPAGVWPVEVDPGELELALLNLSVNARDAMPGGGKIVIEAENLPYSAEIERPGEAVRLSVTDSGAGMPPEIAGRAFEPFFTTKEVGKGTGLGLSQVYGFAQASGGDVRIVSPPGAGATVSIYLPRSLKAPPAAENAVEGPQEKAGQGRILLVEDDKGVAEMVTDMLRELGYRVTHAVNADAAVRQLEVKQAYDLVFSDTVMPGRLDGIGLAGEIRRRWPQLPVLLTTGFSEAAESAAAQGLRLLSKPYRMDALAAAVRDAIAQSDGKTSDRNST